jgi:hypothetical protein
LVAATADGTLPETLSPDQVWSQAGRVQLLDFSLEANRAEETRKRSEGTALALLAEVAALSLEDHGTRFRVATPAHAVAILDRLSGAGQPYESVEEVRGELRSSGFRPQEMTRGLRVAHVAVLGFCYTFVLSFMDAAALNSFDDAAAFLLTPPVVWMVWSFLWRGGLTHHLVGLELVGSDGRRASRLRCGWRTLLIWAPFTALMMLAVCLGFPAPDGRVNTTAAVHWPATLSLVAAHLSLLLYAGSAILFTARGLHDWLAGTAVVPR